MSSGEVIVGPNELQTAPAAHSRTRLAAITISVLIAAVIVAAAAYYALQHGQAPTVSTTVAQATTTINTKLHISNSTLARDLSVMLGASSKQNLLYGLANSANLSQCGQCQSATPSGGAGVIDSYGLPVESEFLDGLQPQFLVIPVQYSDSQLPVAVSMFIRAFNSSSLASQNYTHASQLAASSPIGTSGLQPVPLDIGNQSVLFVSYPPGGAEAATVFFQYDQYFAELTLFGSKGHLNTSYAVGIAGHIESILAQGQ